MFGAFQFGQPYFGQGAPASPTAPATASGGGGGSVWVRWVKHWWFGDTEENGPGVVVMLSGDPPSISEGGALTATGYQNPTMEEELAIILLAIGD